jgi:hypothetical protein
LLEETLFFGEIEIHHRPGIVLQGPRRQALDIGASGIRIQGWRVQGSGSAAGDIGFDADGVAATSVERVGRVSTIDGDLEVPRTSYERTEAAGVDIGVRADERADVTTVKDDHDIAGVQRLDTHRVDVRDEIAEPVDA